jgi:hypothetical protein
VHFDHEKLNRTNSKNGNIGHIIQSIYSSKIMSWIGPPAVCIVLLILSMKLYNADLHIPFTYWGDSLYYYSLTKTVIENGWVWRNSALGAPFGLENYDYPGFNILDILIIKILSFISKNSVFVENLFFLLTFPLTTLTSLIVFRQFKINYAYSFLGSILFAFIPCHFLRGVSHLDVSSYYIIPLMVMVLLWIYRNDFSLLSSNALSIKAIYSDRKMIASILICILSGISFLYYAFFFCFFLLVIGSLSSIKSWRKLPFLISAIFIISAMFAIVVGILPMFIDEYKNGPNFELSQWRAPPETEIYGMKIIQLLLPINGHRIPLFSEIAHYYDVTAPLVNENEFASLGAIASLGFLVLIAYIFFKSSGTNIESIFSSVNLSSLNTNLEGLSILNLSSILFATIGGFSAIFAYSISPQFRTVNRISIFIAFFSLFAILIILEYISKKVLYKYNIEYTKLIYSVACILLVVGMLDQTSDSLIPSYNSIKEEWFNDERFMNSIEEMMPENALIFQLPYMAYPQSQNVNQLAEYSLLKGYLHSRNLRWSYGVMEGRSGDDWIKSVAGLPLKDMVMVLSSAGFDGIYIDSFGYEDRGHSIISNLSKILGKDPLISDDHRLYFFDIRGYDKNASSIISTMTVFGSGFYDLESWSGIPTRWMQSDATLDAFSSDNCTVTLILQALSFHRQRTLEIRSGKYFTSVEVPNAGFINVTARFSIRKGENTILLHVPEGCDRPCEIKELNSRDTRCISVAVQNVRISSEEPESNGTFSHP